MGSSKIKTNSVQADTYKDKKRFIVQYLDKQIEFDVTNPYTQKWFLPRYDFGKIHEPLMVRFMCRILKKGDTFIDLGAHIGYFSIIAAKLCKQVYAFEIDDNCIPIIKENISLNKLDNIEIINKAVSEKSGDEIKISVFEQPNTTLNIRFNPKAKGGHKVIKTLSLSDFVNDKKIQPALIKVDIEGAEFSALKGMEELLKNSKDLKILLEVHPRQLKASQVDSKMIIDYVNKLGYRALYFGSHRNNAGNKTKQINPDKVLTENTMLLIKR